MSSVLLYQWGVSGEEELEVEVAPGFDFDRMVWLMKTAYSEAIWRLQFVNELKRFTLFSPPDYRVTGRKGIFFHYAYHGWRVREADPCTPGDGELEDILWSAVEGHWDTENNPDCWKCCEESRGRRRQQSPELDQILLAGSYENEIQVAPARTFDEIIHLLSNDYSETVESEGVVTLFSPPHNRVIGRACSWSLFPECLHPRWVRTEDIHPPGPNGAGGCPTCPARFQDAMTLACGHSVERTLVMRYWGRNENPPCPGCFEEDHCRALEEYRKCNSMDLIITLQQPKDCPVQYTGI